MTSFDDRWLDAGGAMVELLTLFHEDYQAGGRGSADRIQQIPLPFLREVAMTMLGALYGSIANVAAEDGITIPSALQQLALNVHEFADTPPGPEDLP